MCRQREVPGASHCGGFLERSIDSWRLAEVGGWWRSPYRPEEVIFLRNTKGTPTGIACSGLCSDVRFGYVRKSAGGVGTGSFESAQYALNVLLKRELGFDPFSAGGRESNTEFTFGTQLIDSRR